MKGSMTIAVLDNGKVQVVGVIGLDLLEAMQAAHSAAGQYMAALVAMQRLPAPQEGQQKAPEPASPEEHKPDGA